jgi:hypothetical protein
VAQDGGPEFKHEYHKKKKKSKWNMRNFYSMFPLSKLTTIRIILPHGISVLNYAHGKRSHVTFLSVLHGLKTWEGEGYIAKF